MSFAARVASAFGLRTAVLTSAATDADLSSLEGHDVHVVPVHQTLSFEHRGTAAERELRVAQQSARRLVPSDLPVTLRDATEVILAPLTHGDIDLEAFVAAMPGTRLWFLAQGLQRRTGTDGAIEIASGPSDDLVRALSLHSSVFLSGDETGTWSPSELTAVASRCARLVVTRGREGATVFRGSERVEVAACPADVVDTTGAGDVFATAFILGVSKLGLNDRAAGRLASAFAAASVERTGPAPLPPLREIRSRFGVAAGGLCA